MNIVVDLDNTLVDLPVVEDVSREMGLNYKSSDVVSWGYLEFPEEFRKRIYEKFADSEYMCTLKMYPWVENTLKLCRELEIGVIIATRRNPEIKDRSLKFMNEMFLERRLADRTIFTTNPDKNDIIKHFWAGYLIDDNPHTVDAALDAGHGAVLISNKDTKYNYGSRCSFRLPRFDYYMIHALLNDRYYNVKRKIYGDAV